MTLDIEPDLKDPNRRLQLFENDALLNKYISLVRKHGIKVTGFTVTSLFEPYGSAIYRFAERIPIEFGVHSHIHDQRKSCTEEEIARAFGSHLAFWGTPPAGYRAPNGLIGKEGIRTLMDYGFRYDASIFPSIRFDEYAYSNLQMPLTPFRFIDGRREITELPFACLRAIRLVFSFSFIKLLSLVLYKLLMIPFPLPQVVVLGAHPYDFYIPLLAPGMKGWKKYAHLRNAASAFDIFEQTIQLLRKMNYEFIFMSELCNQIREWENVPEVSLDDW